jgi:hypothetical protein
MAVAPSRDNATPCWTGKTVSFAHSFALAANPAHRDAMWYSFVSVCSGALLSPIRRCANFRRAVYFITVVLLSSGLTKKHLGACRKIARIFLTCAARVRRGVHHEERDWKRNSGWHTRRQLAGCVSNANKKPQCDIDQQMALHHYGGVDLDASCSLRSHTRGTTPGCATRLQSGKDSCHVNFRSKYFVLKETDFSEQNNQEDLHH